MRSAFLIAIVALFLLPGFSKAEVYENLVKKFAVSYPTENYIIGIGAVQSSGDNYKDRRRSEILARLELAKVVRLSTKSKSIDIACEGKGKLVFDSTIECRNQMVQIVEETVDEVLEGSRIVSAGEEKSAGLYYAVAVLQKKDALSMAESGSKEALDHANEHIENSRSAHDEATKKEEAGKAKEELKKSLAYEGQKAAIEQIRQNDEDMFKMLAVESRKIRDK